ncbi:NAD-dependent succinate-semialdehyde dehydrogenase [Salinicoccus sp. ID82-1]|uniref:NAD-dependent succinate-semialdehyde dehydrogenase n=1 Tax=Salinicoccus sp. ID82-1 TaxID=2820269 RepID=UPI001F2C0F8B|nr:NAD-dependent succinate-semialdehyde dehydrogenase [Salinicoccus sp. ID82-1]MCG1009403.1 NAD-dependent succinate-semialdehyde dehydrogenase [Salinicoccus sp. ID82-1]
MSEEIVVLNPATGEEVDRIRKDSKEDIEKKIDKAHEMFKQYKKKNAYDRSALMVRWAALIRENKDEIAELITKENGKPIKEAAGEVEYACSYIDYYAEEGKRVYGRTIPQHEDDVRLVVTKQPIGVVAAITPWNFPVAMMARKAAPAVAAGCTFLVKPASETPLSAMRFLDLALEAGFEEGVIQYVTASGKEAGEVFAKSEKVMKLTFTGSTAVGKTLMEGAASTVKNITMELGGHAPLVVHKDADLDVAVEHAIAAKFRNSGQTCVCANRFYVHEDIAEAFSEKFAEQVKSLKVGNGMDEDVKIGPMINEDGYDKVIEHINDAKDKGGQIIAGGEGNKDAGYFIEPTVITGATDDMIIMNEETFGPVAPIQTFTDLDEAIEKANDTEYGLAAYFFTESYRDGIRLQEGLNFGVLGWNNGKPSAAHIPFGGLKESGIGREGGPEGIEPYLETKITSMKI